MYLYRGEVYGGMHCCIHRGLRPIRTTSRLIYIYIYAIHSIHSNTTYNNSNSNNNNNINTNITTNTNSNTNIIPLIIIIIQLILPLILPQCNGVCEKKVRNKVEVF
jgi:fumarate reductase subunit D